MDEPTAISADMFKYWHVDYQNGSIRVVCQDGQVLDSELEARYRPINSQVARSTFDWEKWWIWTTTTRNDLILTEGFNPASPPPLKTSANDVQLRISSTSPATAALSCPSQLDT
ncbi:hypothetical protein ACFTWF_23430 [Rhodococcus sp. NPDC056960]|uniref:hypothetical protein n=1 Tax=Rhodococcus sp. NPDC056960 TaxID=3345982 RepID=UPI00363E076C